MTRSATNVTVRCLEPAGARMRWYRSLAYALAATRDSGAVFESTLDEPVPWVTVRPGAVLDTARLADVRVAPRAQRRIAAIGAPPPGWAEVYRSILSPFPRVQASAYRSEVGRDRPVAVPDAEPSEWVGVQTHWVRGGTGEVWVARRFRFATARAGELPERAARIGAALAEEWAFGTGVSATTAPAPRGTRRDWRRGAVRTVPADGWLARGADSVVATAEVRVRSAGPRPFGTDGHGVVFGASGAGKTTFLVAEAAREIAAGSPVLAIDLHGDLSPAIVERLPAALRGRVVAVDATDPPTPGIAALAGPGAAEGPAAGHLVAALKRLSPDGQDLYWGFRLERVFDSFARLTLETGGSLLDLYALLTDPARRDAARLATTRPELARFLDELAPLVRRQPDFLWSAATRLSKVVLVPGLADLLAPANGGLPIEDLLEGGRSVLLRLPFPVLGPEAATFAGSLVLARCYLGLASRRRPGDRPVPTLFLLDEAHGFSPRLVAELLTESRKFGIRVILATQHPDRLSLEVRGAVAGAPSDFVTFRVPPAAAGAVGGWIGLARDDGERWLSALPIGHAVRRDPESGSARPFAVPRPEGGSGYAAWIGAVARTREEFGIVHAPPPDPGRVEATTERLLLAVLGAEEEGRPLDPSQVLVAALTLPGPPIASESLGDRWTGLVRERLVRIAEDGCRLTEAGERRLGLSPVTGAHRESAEHRALLLATFRLFARRGYRIEIVPQGRFDTTLPDARFRQLATRPGAPPAELALEVDRVRGGWAWNCFRGRDVHIEVEVSGALRAERVRRGWRKAAGRGAFALFVVGDPARARRVRAALRDLSLRPDRAQVWTLRWPGRPPSASPSQEVSGG